jgi:hypothetical protein
VEFAIAPIVFGEGFLDMVKRKWRSGDLDRRNRLLDAETALGGRKTDPGERRASCFPLPPFRRLPKVEPW